MLFLYLVLFGANLFWLSLVIQSLISLSRIEYLQENLEPVSTPKISILVPARDESRILPRVLESLLKLNYPDFEILLIDDHSTDNTFQIGSEYAQRDPRIRPMKSADLPPGWRGKAWALQQGVALAQGSWLLFTDADVFHHPDTLRCALALAQKEKIDLLSVIPHMETIGFWEKVIIPVFGALLNIVRPMHKSNDPNSTVALASGGFLFMKAMIFRYLGGYEQIQDAMAEDLRLAELFKLSGYRIKSVLTRSKWLKTRMYDSLPAIWEGLSRHAYEIARYNPLRLCFAVATLYAIFVMPAVIFILGIIHAEWRLVLLTAFPVLMMVGMQSIINYKWGNSLLYFFSFPLATFLYGLMMLDSMFSFYLHGNAWKGRRYGKHFAR